MSLLRQAMLQRDTAQNDFGRRAAKPDDDIPLAMLVSSFRTSLVASSIHQNALPVNLVQPVEPPLLRTLILTAADPMTAFLAVVSYGRLSRPRIVDVGGH